MIHKPINCNVMKLNESLACRVPEVFRLRYKQAMNRLKGRQSGVVIVGINPPGQGKKKHSLYFSSKIKNTRAKYATLLFDVLKYTVVVGFA